MSPDPKISLVITVYNRASYLASAIDSVLAQSYSDFELLIWDDGSSDHSLEIAQKYAANDKRIKVVAHEHLGLGWTLKKAIAATSGKYFGWVDSDDLLHKDALSETRAVLEREPNIGMVYTEYQVMDETGNIGEKGKRSSIPYSSERLLIDFMTFHFRLIRRSVYEEVGGVRPEFDTAEDYDLCLRLSEATEIVQIKKPLYYYRVHQNSVCSQKQSEQVKTATKAINQAIKRRGLEDTLELEVQLRPKFFLCHKK
ncbi:MAG: glycosyltransferase [Hydrococcus sp. SU_1_0]|nr:glycosyltransferase [Hydrococcus sp. SU_1_0]